MTLYEIDNQIRLFIENAFENVNEDGEVMEIDPSLLEELSLAREEKLENIACYIKDLEAEVVALKKEEDNLKARRESTEKKLERLKQLLSASMSNAGETKFKTAKCYVTFKQSKAVIVPDVELLDKKFIVASTTYKANKVAIKSAIEAGDDVRGAYIEERQNIQIK